MTEITPSLTFEMLADNTIMHITEPTTEWGTLDAGHGSGTILDLDQIYQIVTEGFSIFTDEPWKSYSSLSGSRFVCNPASSEGARTLLGGDAVYQSAVSPPDIESMILEWTYTDNFGVITVLPNVDLYAKDGGAFTFDWNLVPADAGFAGSTFPDGTYKFKYVMVAKGAWAVWNPGDPYRSTYGKTLETPEYSEFVYHYDPSDDRYQTKLMEFQSGLQDNIVEVSYDALRLRKAIDQKADTKEKNVMCLLVLQRAMRDMHILAFDPDYKVPDEDDVDRYISLASRESRTGNID